MMKTSKDTLTLELLPVASRGATGLCGPFPRGKEGTAPKQTEVGVAGRVRVTLQRTMSEILVQKSAAMTHPTPQDSSPSPPISQGCYRKPCLQDV